MNVGAFEGVYLDNAATTYPKPPEVYQEVLRCMRDYCGNPGRGAHPLALASAEKIYECREEAAALLGLSRPENVVFVPNTSYAINMAIKGLLREGDHILISDMEHNSVFRPVWKMAETRGITYDIFPTFSASPHRRPSAVCEALERLVKPQTKLLFCVHASNICSAALPIREIGEFCRKHKILFALDAAQSAGHLPIDMERMKIDILCAPGHKGLYGPQGSGLLAFREGICFDTLIEGGNGIRSLEAAMPDLSPERYEVGTLPTPAIAGLCAGIRAVRRIGVEAIHAREREFYLSLCEMLSNTKSVTVYTPFHKGSVLLFNVDDISSEVIANRLGEHGICVRSGFHCSPLAHQTLRTPPGGAVRISFGMMQQKDDIFRFYRILRQILKEGP